MTVQLADVLCRLDHISEVWRSDTSDEQRTDLAGVDELLGGLMARNLQQRARPNGSMNSAAGSRS